MERFVFALTLVLILSGCVVVQDGYLDDTAASARTVYSSETSTEDCYLCGGGIESMVPSYWGQNNIALISLNTFEVKPIEINRYDRLNRQLIEEYAGIVSLGGGGSVDGGFSVNVLLDYDRGYATGSMEFGNDEKLDYGKMADFLCTDCLNKILPQRIERCFGVGAINLDTKEIRIFEESLGGFTLGDFYMDCNLESLAHNSRQMDILIFYCPIRYEESESFHTDIQD